MMKPLNVAITGAAGQIGYALAFRVASGQMLGPDQPINLHLLEITPALPSLEGVAMELSDCIEHAYSLRRYLGPNAVAREHCDLQLHSSLNR